MGMEKKELRWLELSAGIAVLIGLAGLVALITGDAQAAEPPKGFQAGSRPSFGVPFANPPATATPPTAAKPSAATNTAGNHFFDDEEDGDFPEDASPTPGRAGGTVSAGGAPSSRPDLTRTNQGISAGGAAAGGVVSTAKVSEEPVDTFTGEGSKEIVTDFNFPDADIMDIAKTLGKLTGKSFILDKDVKGRITIITNGPITVGDAWRAFLTALDINQFALVPSGKFIRIARSRDARDKQLRTYTGDSSPDTDALITRVFPLKYINAEEVARTFHAFMPGNARILSYEQTNTLIVTDTGANISKLAKMLELLDIEGYDAGIEVIPVKFASAKDLSTLIDQLIPGTGATPGAAPGGIRPFGAPSHFNARRTKEGGIINTIIADDRTNTLIVHANTKGADQVRELVAKLDQKVPAPTGGGKVHVRYLQFADAEQISNTLNTLSAQGAGAPRPPMPGGGTGVNPVAATLFEGAIKVSPDKSTNSLVITASPADFATIDRVIDRLDIARDEVYVEVVIMEVALNHTFNFSSNLAAPAAGAGSGIVTSMDDVNTLLTQKVLSGGFLSVPIGSGTTTVLLNGQSVTLPNAMALMKLLQINDNANVLATPQIIALDNTEATFVSSEKVPYPTSTAVQGAGVTQSIQKESVELSIKIKPQINKVSNFVKLDVAAKMSSLQTQDVPAALAQTAFATLERTATTTVVVADSDTVVLGGLIRDNIDDSVTKVPILGDIPLLGWLFKAKTTKIQKTNLLVFLTPHIVRQYEKVRAILDRKLKERDDFLQKNAGGQDPLRDVRDDMIRSLPDIKAIMSEKAKTSVTIDQEAPSTSESPFTGDQPKHAEPPVPTAPSATMPAVPVPPAAGGSGG